MRITATTRLGEGQVIDIQREVELGGAIHSKGVMILSAFLAARFSGNLPHALAASLVFEQTYGHVDGDSASLAELCALLSSLAEVPSKELEALKVRAVKSGFDFIDFWAVDFDWQPGQPFHHDWQDYRTRKDRSLHTVSDAGHIYDAPGKHTICVKVVDVFGCDTSMTLTVEV